MSLPIDANVVHLQLFIALVLHLLCTLYLQTSQLKPCDVTPAKIKVQNYFTPVSYPRQNPVLKLLTVYVPYNASRQTLQYVGLAWLVAYQ